MTLVPTSTALYGHCKACGEKKSVRSLNLIFAPNGNRRRAGGGWQGDGNFALICGPCFVDGFE